MGGSKGSTPVNGTLLQGFEWNCPPDGKHYTRLQNALDGLKNIGVSNIWLPPGCKASSPEVASPPHTHSTRRRSMLKTNYLGQWL